MSRRWSLLLAAPLLLPVPPAAEPLQVGGSFEYRMYPQEVAGQLALQESGRLRLDLQAQAGERVTFAGDVVYRTHHGRTRFALDDLLPRRVVDDFRSAGGDPAQFDIALSDEHFVDNAHATLALSSLSLRLGRQQLPWGTGYTWNPTDLFHAKDCLDPTYEKRGVDAVKAELPVGLRGALTAVLVSGDTWGRSTRALRARGHARGFDLSACVAETREERLDYLTLEEGDGRRRLVGGDLSGELLGLGVWAEGAHSWLHRAADYGQYLVGADYTWRNGLYAMGELYHNGLGRSDAEQYAFADWMRLLSTAGENLGRRYLSLGTSYPCGELWEGSAYGLANLSDGSAVLFPWVDVSLADDAELDLVGYLPFGGAATELGAFGAGGFARLTVYF